MSFIEKVWTEALLDATEPLNPRRNISMLMLHLDSSPVVTSFQPDALSLLSDQAVVLICEFSRESLDGSLVGCNRALIP